MRRRWPLVVGVSLLAVLAALAGGFLVGIGSGPPKIITAARGPHGTVCLDSEALTGDCGATEASPPHETFPGNLIGPARHGNHTRKARRQHRSSPASAPSSGPPPGGTPTPAPAPIATTAAGLVNAVLTVINQARAAAGLPAYTISAGLVTSASKHNLRMAGGCGLSHQCPGEPSLGDRETAAGVHWTSAGENIGEGGPVTGTDAAIAGMAVTLTMDMLNEKPPDDGHRLNILSSTFTHIGIAIYRDSHGTAWMTQDFSN
jgi:uncharacterized protein YkwD